MERLEFVEALTNFIRLEQLRFHVEQENEGVAVSVYFPPELANLAHFD
jgi:hypothetical protein